MNMPTPMTHNNYDKVVTKVCSVAKDVTLETMEDAANEIKGEEEKELLILLFRLMEVGKREGTLHSMES